MNRHARIGGAEKSHLYVELGKLISSVGHESFLTNMHQMIETSVPVSRLELSEWTADDTQSNVLDVQLLGYAGSEKARTCNPLPHHGDTAQRSPLGEKSAGGG